MWLGVTRRFSRFDQALLATNDQIEDARTKVAGVTACLNSAYYDPSDTAVHWMVVGSWGKQTQIVHTEDVDLLFVLPHEKYYQYLNYTGNGQSALLQEVKGVIEARYPNSRMRGDGQVVVVDFNSLTIEVIPAFVSTNGQFLICDTHDGGSFRTTDPVAQVSALSGADTLYNQNARKLTRMMKAWKYLHNVSLKSFQIECLVPEFLGSCAWSQQSYFFYDWLVRDFFEFLLTRANRWVFIPGTYEISDLGDAWVPAARRAFDIASRACDFERDDKIVDAGFEWQKIFGENIEVVV